MTVDVNSVQENAVPSEIGLESVPADRTRTWRRWRSQTQLAMGVSPTPRAGLLVVFVGMALGPYGLGVLSVGVLNALDPALSAALAALGAFIGMETEVRRARDAALLFAGSIESAITLLLVAAGVLAVHALSTSTITTPWQLAILMGICAAPSATTAIARGHSLHTGRIGDFDDVLPILLGVPALAMMRAQTPGGIMWLTLGMTAVALAVAAAGWVLVSRTSSVTEERVFAIGALLLLGGAAAYLSLSALFAGFVAGALWRVSGLAVRDRLTRDLGYLQRPVVALILLIAGARVQVSTASIGLVAVYLVCRIAGKLAGGWFASRLFSPRIPSDLGLSLLSPGIVGIAFALNVVQARAEANVVSMLFTVVVAGSLASDMVSLFIRDSEMPA